MPLQKLLSFLVKKILLLAKAIICRECDMTNKEKDAIS